MKILKFIFCMFVFALLLTPFTSHAVDTDRMIIEPDQFDDTCAPCRDFYQWANGGWLEQTKIPDVYPAWSSWFEMFEKNLDDLHEILLEVSKESALYGSPAQKMGDFYAVGMDTIKIEKDGLKPLNPLLNSIHMIKTKEDLQTVIGNFHKLGIDIGFGFNVDQDLKNNTHVIYYAVQGGLSLPDRDYYTREDESSVALRKQFVNHVTNIFKLTGDNETTARKKAETVLAFETRLANASLTNVELRDPEASYNIISVGDAESLTPNFSWKKYFNDEALGEIDQFSYSHPKFFEEFGKMMDELPISDWQTYMTWHTINAGANYLNNDIVKEHFNFFGTALAGSQEMQPRWKRVLLTANSVLGEVFGQLYVEKRFPPDSKDKALEMIHNISTAMERRLKNLDWMSETTKQKALEKLSTFNEKIGYPDKWRNYSKFEVKRDSYFENVLRGWAFETQRNFDKIGKPVDRTEWGMSPQTVNAYYNPLMNEIVFPAAIMQPPFFSATNDDAINYGSMGAVIGHEISHGFDDEGSQYDADGNLKSWWTESDRNKFNELTAKMVAQYDNFEAMDGLNLNGQLTLGENLADLAGCLIAYEGLQMALKDKPRTKIDGFTPEERFFIAWAETWKHKYRDEFLKLLVQSDVHSPGKFRCNGPLQNMKEFWEAFGCKQGDPMVRSGDDVIKIW